MPDSLEIIREAEDRLKSLEKRSMELSLRRSAALKEKEYLEAELKALGVNVDKIDQAISEYSALIESLHNEIEEALKDSEDVL